MQSSIAPEVSRAGSLAVEPLTGPTRECESHRSILDSVSAGSRLRTRAASGNLSVRGGSPRSLRTQHGRLRIGIIEGSTRPGQFGDQAAKRVLAQAQTPSDSYFGLLTVADQGLALLDEPVPPRPSAGTRNPTGKDGPRNSRPSRGSLS